MQAGSNLILLARRKEALDAIVAASLEASKGTGKVVGLQLDVSDKKQVAGLWDKVPSDLRNVDVLSEKLAIYYLDR